jgi:hypothetical protein
MAVSEVYSCTHLQALTADQVPAVYKHTKLLKKSIVGNKTKKSMALSIAGCVTHLNPMPLAKDNKLSNTSKKNRWLCHPPAGPGS